MCSSCGGQRIIYPYERHPDQKWQNRCGVAPVSFVGASGSYFARLLTRSRGYLAHSNQRMANRKMQVIVEETLLKNMQLEELVRGMVDESNSTAKPAS